MGCSSGMPSRSASEVERQRQIINKWTRVIKTCKIRHGIPVKVIAHCASNRWNPSERKAFGERGGTGTYILVLLDMDNSSEQQLTIMDPRVQIIDTSPISSVIWSN